MTAGWAATNTLRYTVDLMAVREALSDLGLDLQHEKTLDALTRVEAALSAAQHVVDTAVTDGDCLVVQPRHYDALAAALRAVREGK